MCVSVLKIKKEILLQNYSKYKTGIEEKKTEKGRSGEMVGHTGSTGDQVGCCGVPCKICCFAKCQVEAITQ